MLSRFHQVRNNERGFTLIELMIVVAIIGILAAIAVPNFISYRNKSRVSTAVATAEGVRAALAGYAADNPGNTYPGTGVLGSTYKNYVDKLNPHGATLPADQNDVGFQTISYTSDGEDYSIVVGVSVPDSVAGWKLTVSPSGIKKEPAVP